MKVFTSIIILLGVFEIASNLFHLLKGNQESIGLSARKQHQELSSALGYRHFYVKAIIMFIFGLQFTVAGSISLFKMHTLLLPVALGLFALYGIMQALYYKRPVKVWMSLVVYTMPFCLFLILSVAA